MKNHDDSIFSISRREFLRLAGAGATVLGLGAVDGAAHVASAATGTSQPAPGRAKNKGPYNILVAINDKLNGLIDKEVGEDRGQMLPGGTEAGWDITPETMAP
ncbi:MAG: twin-arginine translocation signal domain-containing protein [Desulfobacteraceae bacterium]|nr:twin-arginine translocation signal domain-containing protein [Desulfobacteraceae bacterium]